MTVPLPYGDTELCPARALERWRAAACITDGPLLRRIWLPAQRGSDGGPLLLSRIGKTAITPQSVAQIVQARAAAARVLLRDLGSHSLKRGALASAWIGAAGRSFCARASSK